MLYENSFFKDFFPSENILQMVRRPLPLTHNQPLQLSFYMVACITDTVANMFG